MNDVVIIGGGPAGLTAAIYTCRRGLKTFVVTKDIGGQISRTSEIENYPGFDNISGSELAQKLFAQAKKFGAEIVFDEAVKIEKDGDNFKIKTLRDTVSTRSIILAFGKKPRELGVPGEDLLKGRGVSYCATCDAPFFRNKTVAIVGGGNSALEASILCAGLASKVYLIYRGSELRAEDILQKKAKSLSNIEIIYNDEIAEIIGKERVEALKLKSDKTLSVNGVIIEIGYTIDRSLITGLVEMDETNQVVTDQNQATSVKGIFAAGDLTQTPVKQIVVSAGEGAKAALACYDYLQHQDGKRSILVDWH